MTCLEYTCRWGADQTPAGKLLFRKHRDSFKAEVCGNCETMRGDNFQIDGRGRRGDNRRGGRIQVNGTSSGSVRRRLVSGQTEY